MDRIHLALIYVLQWHNFLTIQVLNNLRNTTYKKLGV